MKPALDITGQTFGKLTAERRVGADPQGFSLWLFRCACGNAEVRPSATVRHTVTRGHEPKCLECNERRPRGRHVAEGYRERGRRKVTPGNYRRVAAGFSPEQVARLREIMRRHPAKSCYLCARGLKCPVGFEAVEMVVDEYERGKR